jgi:MFS family permease
LVSSSGAGALIGTFYLAARKSVLGLERMIQVALFSFGLGLVAFSFSRNLVLSMFILLFIGFGMIVGIASSNTILQTIVPDDKRGRVMSFYIMAFMGAAPLGSLATGILSNATSAPFTILVNGIAAVLFAGFFAYRMPRIRELIHPVYQEKGIIKEVALGIQTAAELRNPPK